MLTDVELRTAKPKAKSYKLSDGHQLYLLVAPTGSKLWRIPALRMKGGQERKREIDGDHLVPLSTQSVDVLNALHPVTGSGQLLFPSARQILHPMSENAIGYLLDRAGYHGRHVPHRCLAAFSTIMNEWAKRNGRADDREVIDLMLANVPKDKVEGAYNRAAYLPRRRELVQIWGDILMAEMPGANTLVENASRVGQKAVAGSVGLD